MNVVSIEVVKQLNSSRGQYWFSEGALKFFKSRFSEFAWTHNNGYLFWSSEKGPDEVRRYSVRFCNAEGIINTIGEFQQFKTSRAAQKEIERLLSSKGVA